MSDQADETRKTVTVGHVQQIFYHVFRDHACRGFGNTPQGQMEHIQHHTVSRILVHFLLQKLENAARQDTLAFSQTGQRIVDVDLFRPAAVGNGSSQQAVSFTSLTLAATEILYPPVSTSNFPVWMSK